MRKVNQTFEEELMTLLDKHGLRPTKRRQLGGFVSKGEYGILICISDNLSGTKRFRTLRCESVEGYKRALPPRLNHLSLQGRGENDE